LMLIITAISSPSDTFKLIQKVNTLINVNYNSII
jgi:hypothetical protein